METFLSPIANHPRCCYNSPEAPLSYCSEVERRLIHDCLLDRVLRLVIPNQPCRRLSRRTT